MTAQQTAVLLLASLSLLTTWIGVLLAIRLRENAVAIATGIGFSAGIMLLVSLIELVPAALGMILSAAVYLLLAAITSPGPA